MSTPDGGERMTAQPLLPGHLLTIGEYAELGEDEHGYSELQEGRLVMSPSPAYRHMIALTNLVLQLSPQVPPHLQPIAELDIDLEFAAADQPGSSRRPDLIVVRRSALERLDAEGGGMMRASDVVVAVEVTSPGSRRTDNVIKRSEYADAGIEHYWIIDVQPPISLVECHRTEEFGYRDGGAVTEVFSTDHPFGVTLRLDELC
jgi:Uma2 family endonuclease